MDSVESKKLLYNFVKAAIDSIEKFRMAAATFKDRLAHNTESSLTAKPLKRETAVQTHSSPGILRHSNDEPLLTTGHLAAANQPLHTSTCNDLAFHGIFCLN